MAYFPIFADLQNKTVLLVGSGRHIEEKIARLEPYGPILRRSETFREEDLEPRPVFVVSSGEDPATDKAVSEACRARGIPVNVVDVPPLCTFYFPALFQRGSLSLGVCSAGKSPGAAALLRDKTAALVPENVDDIMDWSLGLRPLLAERFPDKSRRRRASRALLEAAFQKDRPLTQGEQEAVLRDI